MQIKELSPAESADNAAAAYPAFRAASLESKPGFPPPGLIRLRTQAAARRGLFSRTLAAVTPDGAVAGVGIYGGELTKNLDLAWINLFVPADGRKQGADTALVEHARRLAANDGRTRLSVMLSAAIDPEPFAAELGGRNLGTVLAADLDLTGIDQARYAAWAAASTANARYSLVRWDDRCPDELTPSYCAAQDAMHDQPAGEYAYEFAHTETEQMRADEQHIIRFGARHHVMAAVDEAGRVCGFAEFIRYPDEPAAVEIWSTGVARDHRGHGLGLRLKAASTLWMRELAPGARHVSTANHAGNDAMIRINRTLGYQPAEHWYSYEFPTS